MSGPEKLILPQELKIEKGEGSLGNVEKQDLEKNYLALREYAEDLQKLIDNLDKSQTDKVIKVPFQGEMRLQDFLQQTLERAIWLDKDGSFDKWNYEFVPDIQDVEKVEAMREMLDKVQSVSPFSLEKFSEQSLPGSADLDLNDRLLDLESKTVTERVTPADYILVRSRLKRLSSYFERVSGKDFYDSETDTLTVKDAAVATVETADSKTENEAALSVAAEDSVNALSEALSKVRYAFVKNLKEVIKSGELKEFMIKTGSEVMYGSDQSVLEFVKEMQKYLAAKGYADKLKYSKNDGIDGLIGPRTLQSLRGYLAEDKEAANAEAKEPQEIPAEPRLSKTNDHILGNESVNDNAKEKTVKKVKKKLSKPQDIVSKNAGVGTSKAADYSINDTADSTNRQNPEELNESYDLFDEPRFRQFVFELAETVTDKEGFIPGTNTIKVESILGLEAELKIKTENSLDSGLVSIKWNENLQQLNYSIKYDGLGPIKNRKRIGSLPLNGFDIGHPISIGKKLVKLYEELRINKDVSEDFESTNHKFHKEIDDDKQISRQELDSFCRTIRLKENLSLRLKTDSNQFPLKFELIRPYANADLVVDYNNEINKVFFRLSLPKELQSGALFGDRINVKNWSEDIDSFKVKYMGKEEEFVKSIADKYDEMIKGEQK